MEDSKWIRVKIKENSVLYRTITEWHSIEKELYNILSWDKQCFIRYMGEYIDIIKFFWDITPEDKSKIKKLVSNTMESTTKLKVKIQWIKFYTIHKIKNWQQIDNYLEKLFSKDWKLIEGVNFSVTNNEIFFLNKNGIDKNTIKKIYLLVKKLWWHKKVDITHVNDNEIIEITVIKDMNNYAHTKTNDFY